MQKKHTGMKETEHWKNSAIKVSSSQNYFIKCQMKLNLFLGEFDSAGYKIEAERLEILPSRIFFSPLRQK